MSRVIEMGRLVMRTIPVLQVLFLLVVLFVPGGALCGNRRPVDCALILDSVSVLGVMSKTEALSVVQNHLSSLKKYYRGDGSTSQTVLSVDVGSDGTVKHLKILRGAPDWEAFTLTGEISSWTFRKTDDGNPARIIVAIFVNK